MLEEQLAATAKAVVANVNHARLPKGATVVSSIVHSDGDLDTGQRFVTFTIEVKSQAVPGLITRAKQPRN
jgi:hypothetical protein